MKRDDEAKKEIIDKKLSDEELEEALELAKKLLG